tara:strand:- start:701 stop:2404 length:1704 start_codon:yes stop_codon:yes gene_type:complete
MAITFESNNSNITEKLTIGGDLDGNFGPYPRYSISREEIFAQDGTYLNSKFTINISGTATINKSDTSDAITAGLRTSRVAGEQIIKLDFNRGEFPMIGTGKLVIQAQFPNASDTENTTNEIVFRDASVVSVTIPENQNQSSGIHYTEYNFVFEAYDIGGNISTDMVSSIEESWQLTENNQYAYQGDDVTTTPYKTFTLTHSLSATGVKKYDASKTLGDDGKAWRQAALWIEKRLVDIPSSADIASHINNQVVGTLFNPLVMDEKIVEQGNAQEGSRFIPDLSGETVVGGDTSIQYEAYNHVRQGNVDISGAGYNVTDTWILSLKDTKTIHNINVNISGAESEPNTTIQVDGTITGLEAGDLSNVSTIYYNAEQALNTVLGHAFNLGKTRYDSVEASILDKTSSSAGLTRALSERIISKSIGHNKNTGTITWSVSYTDQTFLGLPPAFIDKVLSQTLDVAFENRQFLTKRVALIPVAGKFTGPIVHTFGQGNNFHTTESSTTIESTLVFTGGMRTLSFLKDNEAAIKLYVEAIKGNAGATVSGDTAAQNISWNFDTGELSISHTYKAL